MYYYWTPAARSEKSFACHKKRGNLIIWVLWAGVDMAAYFPIWNDM